ncbi:hypothetical protein HAX54_053284 [Datura stramonium]|uniref:Uncharacterized protein n=1 Tax=Datura stramonium TaxID=4076 RepID=A0ABS8T185_DATST|nr:hypothetical protein [Datura stramonium]
MPTTSSTPLVRHSSSPARFLNQLATAAGDTGFSVSMGRGSYNSKGVGDSGRGITRLNSQLSFTRQETLSQIAERKTRGCEGPVQTMARESQHILMPLQVVSQWVLGKTTIL